VPPGEEPREAGIAVDEIFGGHSSAPDSNTDARPAVEPESGPQLAQVDEFAGEEALTPDTADPPSSDDAADATGAADPATPESSKVAESEPEATTSESEAETSGPEVAAPEPEADAAEPDGVASDPQAETSTPAAADAAGIGAGLGGPAERFEWKKKRRPRAVSRPVYAVAAAALVVGVLLQLVLEYRDTLAAHVPATRPLLAAACKPLGCTIGPLRDGAALSIDASDLQADPAHRGLLLLSATIRNRSGHAIAFPYLELMLTDSSDRAVVRRAFPPAEYASGSADLAAGIPPNGEHVVRMFLDASATQQAGYRVYLFYP